MANSGAAKEDAPVDTRQIDNAAVIDFVKAAVEASRRTILDLAYDSPFSTPRKPASELTNAETNQSNSRED